MFKFSPYSLNTQELYSAGLLHVLDFEINLDTMLTTLFMNSLCYEEEILHGL